MEVSWQQIVGLFILAIPIACVARTVVFEDVFREPREWCERMSKRCRSAAARKFFYLFTCEYCFSHWVTLAALLLIAAGPGEAYYLLYPDWRGYLVAFFSLVLVANFYMNIYARLRVDITHEKKEIEVKEKEKKLAEKQIAAQETEIRRMNAQMEEAVNGSSR